MLKQSKIAHRGQSHPYHKIILANLCIMAYWKDINFIGYQLINTNISLVNEELGEMTFSMLARCVLGDNYNTNIDHVNKLYALLPICKSVKDDVLDDVSSSSSMSWRHKIDPVGSEVLAVSHFFKQKIAQLNRINFNTYDGSAACYKSRTAAASYLTREVTPVVYLSNVLDLLPSLFDSISATVHGDFLQPFTNIWPPLERKQQQDDCEEETESSSGEEDHSERQRIQWGADWEGCVIGHFSVSRVAWPGGQKGISIHKVRSIDESKVHQGGNVYHSFQGREYRCTKDAWDINCVTTGKWYVAPGSSVANDTLFSYDVVTYFSSLEPGGRLPTNASLAVRQQHKKESIFSAR